MLLRIQTIAKKIIRGLAWLFISLGAIILLLIGLLQLPAVQDRLTGLLENNLSEQLHTQVQIGRIGLDFPKFLTIEEVYMATPAGDSLFALGKLGVDINMLRLFKKEVLIQRVKIADIYAHVVITDSTSNIQFLLDAFLTNDTSASTRPKPQVADSTVAWTINFPHTSVDLTKANVYYQDDPAGILLDGRLGSFFIRSDEIDLEEQFYAIDKLEIAEGDVFLRLQPTTIPADSTATTPGSPAIRLTCRELSVADTRFELQSAPLNLALQLPEANLDEATLALGDSIVFQALAFQVQDGHYAMDLPTPPLSRGLDYNHLDLSNIQIEARKLHYSLDSILLDVEQLQASDKSGLVLQTLSGQVHYAPDRLMLQQLLLKTDLSSLEVPEFDLQYHFQDSFTRNAPLLLASNAQADIAIGDLLYLVPQLDTITLLQRNRNQRLLFDIQGAGNQERLDIDRIMIDGPGLRMRANALLENVLNEQQLSGVFHLTEFAALPRDILPLLPDSLLPTYINWPRQLEMEGDLRYAHRLVTFNLQAQEERDSTPINSILAVSGSIRDLQQYPSSVFDLRIDTLRATRYSALAYLPANSIPEGYHLPDFLKGSGTIKGPVNDLDLDLRVSTESERTQLEIIGHLQQVLQPDSLTFDLRVPALVVDIPELREILPDSTLPTDLNFPDFRITLGQLQGQLDDLNFRLPLQTINGKGLIAGHYAPENFFIEAEISGFQPEKLYRGARADTLALLALEPLSLTLESSGQLEPELNAQLDLSVYEGVKGALLNLEGTARRDTFSGNMQFSHPDLQGTASATYIGRDSMQAVEGSVEIIRADLERWRLSDRPLYLSGKSSFSSTGLNPDDLSARLRMDHILLRSDTSSAYVDTLVAYAEMHQGNNEVEIFSDLLNFSLEGSFRPVLVFAEIRDFLQAYWREEVSQPDPVVYGNYLKAYLEIRNPRPLTSGIIPGLRAISPMTATFIYREKEPELVISAQLPLLNYAGIEMDSLVVDTRGSEGEISYRADWKNINLFDQVVLGKTRISGENSDEAITANFQVWDGAEQLIHHLQFLVDPEPDSLLLQLGPEQLIDNTNWTIAVDNQILISNNRISVNNWKLSNAGQSLTLSNPGADQLEIDLQDIQLSPFSRLIRSKEEIFVGVLDGNIKVSNPLTQARFDAQVDVYDLSVYEKLWGHLSLDLANRQQKTYNIDLKLEEGANDLSLAGTFVPDGKLGLQLNIGALQLQSVEPLSLGYLSRAQGHLEGAVSIGGTFANPSYQGQLQLVDAAVDIELLKTRFHIGQDPIRFDGQKITISKLSLFDPQNNEAVLSGQVTALSLTNYAFDLSTRARDFLVLNTTKDDNPLYYGYLRADADVNIRGDLYQPQLQITASPKENSQLTYNLVQNTVPQAESRTGVLRFVERYEWQQTIVADSLQQQKLGLGGSFSLTTNLNVNPGLKFTVVIDPLTGDQFTGRGEGDIVFRQFPDGKMEMTGRIEMVEGLYDFTYQGLINRQFTVEPGSSINWQGDPMNPNLDLNISSYVKASPYPLVNEFTGSTESNLRRQQTFAVRMYLKGTLEDMQVSTDILYPEEISGNTGLPVIDQSLSTLRTDQSRLNTQAFGLLLFKGFVNFGESNVPTGAIDNSVQSGLDNVLSQQLNNLANRYISFVELDFGLESYNTSQGGRQRDLRLSLRKRLFNNRLIISVDGVTQTGESDENNTLPQTYLDNLTAEFLLTKNGGLRLKVFSDRELDQFTTGDVVRVGGRLAFSKDFDRFFWASDKDPAKDPGIQAPKTDEASRDGEQKVEIREN